MPTFSYKGYDFDVDHTPTAEEFNQMQSHVDSLPPKESNTDKTKKLLQGDNSPEKTGEALKGLGEAGLSLGTGMAAGLAAIPMSATRAALFGEGDVQKGADAFAERNTFEPRTKAGQDIMQNISPILEGMQALGPIDPTHGLSAMVEARALKNAKASTEANKIKFPMKKEGANDIPGTLQKSAEATQLEKANNTLLASLEDRKLKARTDEIQANAEKATKNETDSLTAEINQILGRDRMQTELDTRAKAQKEQQAAILADLEAKLAEDQKAERPNLTSLEDETGQQSLFDQGDQMGQKNQFNADGNADWRIDENGMPVRVDKSLEALNVEQPLQRGLWGDELGPALDQGRSLTEAIDATPANGQWAQRRGMINRLGGRGQELTPGNDLLAAIQEANGPKLPFDETAAFDPKAPLPTEKLGNLPTEPSSGLPGPVMPPDAPWFHAADPGKEVTRSFEEQASRPNADAQFAGPGTYLTNNRDFASVYGDRMYTTAEPPFRSAFDFNQVNPVTRKSNETLYKEKVAELGSKTEANRWLKEQGYDAISFTAPRGEKIINAFEPKRLEDVGPSRESQTGFSAELELLPIEERPVPVDSITHPVSPEMVAKKTELGRAAEHMPGNAAALDEYREIRTKEEAKANVLENPKDITKDYGQRNLSSGINLTSALFNSPVLKYARTILKDARVAADKFSRTYVTAKDGIAPMWTKLDGDQRVAVHEALLEGDRRQSKITDAEMSALEFTPEQKQYVNKFYEADDALYNRYNGNLMAAGFKPLTYRDGHYPGIFKGAYKSLVTDAKGNVVGVVAVDSVYQRAKAKEWFAKEHQDYKIVDQDRKGLADYKSQSDIFSGMNDVMQLLADNDPKFAEVQAMVSEAIKHGNNSLFAFNRHELSKKGVIGGEGNKPWQDATKNAEAAHKALVQYMEEGALHHELQTPLKDLKELSIDPELAPLIPNTMKYLDGYVKHVTGQNVGAIGRGVDAVLDAAPKLLGFGPRVPLQIAGTLKNKMSQKFMGFGNWTFTAAQLMQPMQTGLPFMQLAASRLGNHLDTPRAMMVGGTQFMLAGLEDMTGKKVDGLKDYQREAYQYAKDRGMLNFSEMERAYEGSQSKAGRAFDKAAEFNMKVGEVGTRTPMFMSFVELIHNGGVPLKEALAISENLTQLSMIDYHQWERPQMYQKLGTIGQFAGGLTTFKHGFIGQQAVLGKEIARTGNPVPIAMSVAAMIALAGITGAPAYDELDNAYGFVTNQFLGGRRNIREDVLKNLPEWSKSGAIANATNIGIGSKFSSANMVPDTVGKAVSPQLEALSQIVINAIDLAKNGDAQGARNLLQSAVPSSVAGETEHRMARDSENFVIGKDGKRVIQRSDEDWNKRRLTGMRPQSEVNAREQTYQQRMKLQADLEKQKEIGQKATRMEINKTLTPAEMKKLEDDNIKRGGNPGSLIQRLGQASIDAKKTEKQRLEGTPAGSVSNIKKFQNFNPPAVNKPGER